MLPGMLSMMRPLLISSIRAEGRNRNNSFFITSGNAPPDPNVPNPVVDEEPSATTVRVLPACSFALMPESGAPSDNPRLNARQASDGLAELPGFCAWLAVPQAKRTASNSKPGERKNLDILVGIRLCQPGFNHEPRICGEPDLSLAD